MRHRRGVPLALLPLLVAAAPAQAGGAADPAADPASREARVLQVLRKLPEVPRHLFSTPLVPRQNEYGCECIAPSIGGLCGFGWSPPFDPELALRLARELFLAYGLEPETSVPAPGGVAARLDLFDRTRGIGLVLRGRRVEPPADAADGAWPRIEHAPAELDLDVAEARQLSAQGLRIHTASSDAWWSAHSEDAFTTTLAYLCTVVRFLDAETAGPDVDPSALFAPRAMWIPVPTPKLPAGVTAERFSDILVVRARKAFELSLEVDPRRAEIPSGPRAEDPRTRPLAERKPAATPLGNGGKPTVIDMLCYPGAGGGCTVELVQGGKVLATSDSGVVFAPGAFDSARPFTLRVRLLAGEHRLRDMVWVAAPDR